MQKEATKIANRLAVDVQLAVEYEVDHGVEHDMTGSLWESWISSDIQTKNCADNFSRNYAAAISRYHD